MAALNRTETENLIAVEAIIEHLLKKGYDPEKKEDEHIGRLLEKSKAAVNTVVAMKGYYPS